MSYFYCWPLTIMETRHSWSRTAIFLLFLFLTSLCLEMNYSKSFEYTQHCFCFDIQHFPGCSLHKCKYFSTGMLNWSSSHIGNCLHREFFKSRLAYYANCTASFNPCALVLSCSGDMTSTMSLPWQHSWLQSLSVKNQISPFAIF